MASKRILKELKDLQKDPPTSCSAEHGWMVFVIGPHPNKTFGYGWRCSGTCLVYAPSTG